MIRNSRHAGKMFVCYYWLTVGFEKRKEHHENSTPAGQIEEWKFPRAGEIKEKLVATLPPRGPPLPTAKGRKQSNFVQLVLWAISGRHQLIFS